MGWQSQRVRRSPGSDRVIGVQQAAQAPNRERACGCGRWYLATGTASELRLWPRACGCVRFGTRLAAGLVRSDG